MQMKYDVNGKELGWDKTINVKKETTNEMENQMKRRGTLDGQPTIVIVLRYSLGRRGGGGKGRRKAAQRGSFGSGVITI